MSKYLAESYDKALRENDALRYAIKVERGKTEKADEDNERLRSRLAEAERDSQRLDWLERHLFEGKWDGTIGRPKSWHMAGPYRHTLRTMQGDVFRVAIDAAMQAEIVSGEGER